jgi:hypothetical protein
MNWKDVNARSPHPPHFRSRQFRAGRAPTRQEKGNDPNLEAEAKQVPEVVAETKLPEAVEERLPAVTAEITVVVAAETTAIDVIEEPDLIEEQALIFEERKIALAPDTKRAPNYGRGPTI